MLLWTSGWLPGIAVGGRGLTDQTLVGGTLLWRPDLIEYSIEYSRDLKEIPGKPNYSYAAARVIVAL